MEREVMWAPWTQAGLEHLRLVVDEDGSRADGLVIGTRDDQPFRVHYELHCDAAWRVREVRVVVPGSPQRSLVLFSDGSGHWTTDGQEPVPALDGGLDVDLSITPFTNTLPIRRLGLRPGEAADLLVAYVDVPDLAIERVQQRYRCLQLQADGGLYSFELPSGFSVTLPVDADGLVLDYPGLFRRIWPA